MATQGRTFASAPCARGSEPWHDSSSRAPVANARKYVIADRRQHGEHPGPGLRRHQPDAPPHGRVAEVVRMPRPAPQAAVHDPATVRRIPLERRELGVADRPRTPPRRATPTRRARPPSPAPSRSTPRPAPAARRTTRRAPARRTTRRTAYANRRPSGAPASSLSYRGSSPAPSARRPDVPRQARAPQRDEHREQQRPARPRADDEGHPRDADEHQAPRDVDDADPAAPPGHERRRDHRGRCGGEGGSDDGEQRAGHQRRPGRGPRRAGVPSGRRVPPGELDRPRRRGHHRGCAPPPPRAPGASRRARRATRGGPRRGDAAAWRGPGTRRDGGRRAPRHPRGSAGPPPPASGRGCRGPR